MRHSPGGDQTKYRRVTRVNCIFGLFHKRLNSLGNIYCISEKFLLTKRVQKREEPKNHPKFRMQPVFAVGRVRE